MRRIFTAAIIMFLLQIAAWADAASIVLVPGGGGVYYVRAVDFGDVGGVEIEIQYDTATLSNPRITQGSLLASTMFIPNPKFSASSVKIAAMSLSAIKGSGDLATISFDLKGEKSGPVTIVRSKLAAVTGTSVKHDTPAAPVASGDTGSSGATGYSEGSTGSTGSTTVAATGGSVAGITVSGSPSVGTITLPTDQLAAGSAERKTDYQPLVTDLRKDMTLPLGGSGGAQASAGQQQSTEAKSQEKKFVSYKSTVQLFREFKGEKSSMSLIPLFAELSIPGFAQEPPIAFSDGKTPLKITLVIKQSGSESPKFILQGASVKKLSGEGEETITWTIEAVAKKDATEAVLSVIDGQSVMEIPLTVVPKIDPMLTKGKALSEADFARYLAKPQKLDLNKDEKIDAVDDYIYTANYIVAMKLKPEKVKKEEKKDAPKAEVKGEVNAKEPAKLKDEKNKSVEKTPVKP